MKRITIFETGKKFNGRVIAIHEEDSLQTLLEKASDKLGILASNAFTTQGGLIDDIDLVKDDDVLFFSESSTYLPTSPQRRPLPSSTTSSSTSASGTGVPSLPAFTSSRKLRAISGKSEWITLNVGGRYFTTTLSTLRREPCSMLARMFAEDEDHTWSSCVDSQGAYLMDRSPGYFEPVLNYLRHGEVVIDKGVSVKGVLEEARYFGLQELFEQLEIKMKEEQPATDYTAISRRQFIATLLATPSNCELRCQGINFNNANLSQLDLRYINFKFATFRGADLSGASLHYCNFERADLSNSILDGAILLGAKMMRVNLENASMKACNFEDPAGSRANLENANLKYANLEGSHLSGVNLRVAKMKQANLQNCDLRAAVLAGADLEDADLTRSDLQEANLRGANLKGASLELMVNPLHMSQTITQR